MFSCIFSHMKQKKVEKFIFQLSKKNFKGKKSWNFAVSAENFRPTYCFHGNKKI